MTELGIDRRESIGRVSVFLMLALCTGRLLVADAVRASFPENGPGTAAIEYVDCWTDDLKRSSAKCGLLEVPFSYERPSSESRRVSFAILPATKPPPREQNDPIVFLIGGPGPAGSFTDEFANDGPGEYLRRDRNLIMVDYRGVGMSEPFLGCAGPPDLESCKQVLDESGMVLELRTAVFARDVDRLLETLGHNSVSLYSGSYGTRVALTMLRDVPQRVTHVVLDSVFPPEVNGFTQGSRSILAGLNHIAEACASEPECAAQLGDIREQIMDLAEQWSDRDDAPMLLATLATLSHLPESPLLVHELAVLPAAESARIVSQFMRDEDSDDESGEDDEMSEEMEESERAMSFVMALGIVCSEEAAFIDRQPLNTTRHGFSGALVELVEGFEGGAPFPPSEAKQVCAMLEIKEAPDEEMEPVRSEIPTLVLSGGMDLETSFEWGELAASRLDNARHFVFPFAGHVVAIEDACAKEIASQFVRDPAARLDTTCLNDQIQRSRALVLSSPDVVAEIEDEMPARDEE